MNAAVFYSPNNLSVQEIQFPTDLDEKGSIMLKVNACAVCGYDVRVFRNGHSKVTPPIILGHEFCGEILKAATPINATTTTTTSNDNIIIKEGSRVAVCPVIPCLNCRYCYNKQYNLCINLKEIGSTVNGGFAEYVKIPKNVIQIGGLVSVPDNLSNEEAALLEPLACCLNAFSHIGQIITTTTTTNENKKDKEREGRERRERSQSVVVIIGDGPIGLLHLQLSKLYGAKTIVVGKISARIQKAKSMGADEVIFTEDDDHQSSNGKETSDNVLEFTDGIGANIVIVATSNPAALDLAIKIAAKNSIINIFAGMPKENSNSNNKNNKNKNSKNNTVLIDPNWLHYNQISITGSFSSTPSMLYEAARLASTKQVDLSKIVSHRYSLSNIEEAILATEKYYGLRAVINRF
ncbi:MAG: alcohol dehydrogenase catalytic domain-containing protein [Nitrososphaeraceae archaeon]